MSTLFKNICYKIFIYIYMCKQACMCTSRSLIPNSFIDLSLVWRHSSIQKLIFHKPRIQHQSTKNINNFSLCKWYLCTYVHAYVEIYFTCSHRNKLPLYCNYIYLLETQSYALLRAQTWSLYSIHFYIFMYICSEHKTNYLLCPLVVYLQLVPATLFLSFRPG
jgi:hypothetical protein